MAEPLPLTDEEIARWISHASGTTGGGSFAAPFFQHGSSRALATIRAYRKEIERLRAEMHGAIEVVESLYDRVKDDLSSAAAMHILSVLNSSRVALVPEREKTP